MNKNIVLGLGKIQSVFISPHTACNNKCAYCNVVTDVNLPYKINASSLRNHTEKFINFIKEIKEELEDNCQFIILGGEPLITWHSWLIPLIKELLKINPNFTFRLSTNGNLLTSEKYKEIEQYKIDLNISLDGPKRVHNLNRKLISGVGNFDLVYNNFLNIPLNLSEQLHLCSTIHLNTVKFLPEVFEFIIDTYEKRPFAWYTMNEAEGFIWKKEHLEQFEFGMNEIKKMQPVKFNVNFIPNPPRSQNLIFDLASGLISIRSNELSNPVNSIIGNITKEDKMIFPEKLENYRKIHLEKQEKRILPQQELCNICPGKNHYCIRKEKDFFKNERTYNDLKNFCNHNYILNKVFGGNYYDSRRV